MSSNPTAARSEWEADCLEYRGKVLTGRYAHWCPEWDDLPIDETCDEWPCGCGIQNPTAATGVA